MSPSGHSRELLSDPEWLPAHWIPPGELSFVHLPRERHSEITFLSEEYLGPLARPSASVGIDMLRDVPATPAPQYVFHSAFAASTLLARVFDVPGASFGLKEPEVLNELADAARTRTLPNGVLAAVVRLLARPFGPGEKIVIKPSNVVNLLAPALLDLDPGSNAIFLHAPLPRFLRSVADKGLWGRRWARQLHLRIASEGAFDLGFSAAERFELTDLQVAALDWLIQHSQAQSLLDRFPKRVRILDSEVFLTQRAETIAAAARHLGLAIDEAGARTIAEGPVFATHSKEIGRAFDPEAPLEPKTPLPIVDEEISMVTQWTQSVAEHAGIAIEFPPSARLLPTA